MLRRVKRIAFAAALAIAACQTERPAPPAPPAAPAVDRAAHEKEVTEWQRNRDTRLRREDGWLTLVGLHWLSQGANTIGSAASSKIKLPPNAPASIGTLTLTDGAVTLRPAKGAPVTIDGKPVTAQIPLRDDNSDQGPMIVQAGPVNFQIIKRSDRFGVRVKDPQSETRLNFKGLEYFPIDPKWRVVAKFEPYQPAREIEITDVTGFVSKQPVPGALAFEVDGKPYRLDAIDEGGEQFFIIFKDETSKDVTYPAGRYLYVAKPGADGTVIVDFNKAYSPPCVFTPFATCPLPPPQNRLPIRIEAGEKNWEGAKH